MQPKQFDAQLALLQMEQYDGQLFLAKRGKIDPEIVRRMRMTTRLKLTKYLSRITGIYLANQLIGVGVAMAEQFIYLRVKKRIKRLKEKGMKVVAVVGSYGKSSVKHYTYELLRTKYRVVATPESFNTIMGIAKCLDYEVNDKTEIFIAEVGAYHIGDIAHIMPMVSPDIGVLTGMARQHLERFGSWENIQRAKSEIAVYMHQTGGKLVANGSDATVVANVEKLGVKAVWYRGNDRHEVNLNAGKKVAELLGMSQGEVNKVVPREPRSRFEMTTTRYGMPVIDDSFSSNDVGFVEAVKYLSRQKQYTRILVTPGLVELGGETARIHQELGKRLQGAVDYVILVGRNERTTNLDAGIGGKVPTSYIDKTLEFVEAVKKLKLKKEPLVLLENDVPENY